MSIHVKPSQKEQSRRQAPLRRERKRAERVAQAAAEKAPSAAAAPSARVGRYATPKPAEPNRFLEAFAANRKPDGDDEPPQAA
jgi:hypothetical protein